ncbi:MAG: hypothetical protein Tsb009_35840 [Planctomycetaceae bacterium]
MVILRFDLAQDSSQFKPRQDDSIRGMTGSDGMQRNPAKRREWISHRLERIEAQLEKLIEETPLQVKFNVVGMPEDWRQMQAMGPQ